MKKEYLKELRTYLEENNVENVDNIMDKYERRYEFGLESQLSEEEIEKMLGSKEDILEKYKTIEPSKEEFTEEVLNYKKGYNLVMNTTSDDVVIEYYNEDKIKVLCEDINTDAYNIKIDNENGVLVDYAKINFFGSKRAKGGRIIVRIPQGKVFDKIKISTTSGDILTKGFESNTCTLNTASGDYEIGSIISNQLSINTVSGDYEIDRIKTKKTTISSVSGDFDIFLLDSNVAVIDTVSGDVKIKKADVDELKANSISGDIKINNEEYKNFGKKVKGVFKK